MTAIARLTGRFGELGSLITMVSLAGVSGLNLLCLILIAAVLPQEDFGLYILATTIGSIVGECVGLGGYQRATQAIAAGRDAAGIIGSSATVLALVSALTVVAVVVGAHLAGTGLPLVFAAAFLTAEVFVLRLMVLFEGVFIALGRLFAAAACRVGFAASRLVVLVAILPFAAVDLDGLGLLCLAATVPAVAAGIYLMVRARVAVRFGSPFAMVNRFAISMAAVQFLRAASQHVDKLLVFQLGAPAMLAVYGLLGRFLTFGFLPAFSYLRTVYPVHFRPENAGRQARWRVILHLGTRSLVFAGLGMAACVIGYYVSGFVLGERYANYLGWIAVLSLTIIPLTVINLLTDSLSGQGRSAAPVAIGVAQAVITVVVFGLLVRPDDETRAFIALLAATGLSMLVAIVLNAFASAKTDPERPAPV